MGGRQNGSISKKTWVINPNNKLEITEAPSMNVARMEYACGKMEFRGNVVLIVAGGWNWAPLHSVEIFDPTSNKFWIFGKIFIKVTLKNYRFTFNSRIYKNRYF